MLFRSLCFIIPRRGKANLEMCYKGFLYLAWNSGKIHGVGAHVVYSNDKFSIENGSEEQIRHTPDFKDRGEMIGVFAIIHLDNGGKMFRYLTKDEVESCRPETWRKSVWGSPNKFVVAEMWRKTAIKRLFKVAPLSPQLQQAVVYDEATERNASLSIESGAMQIIEHQEDNLRLPVGGGEANNAT